MVVYWISMALTIVSNVLYHVFQKSISSNVNPFISLIVTYFTAIIVSLIALPFYPSNTGVLASFKQVNWASIALGVGIIGLELGFLLAYRAGWNINLAGILSNVTVALILLPIGALVFGEKLTLINGLGIGLCLIGLVLVNYK